MQTIRENYSEILSKNLLFLMNTHNVKRKQVSRDLNIPYTTYTDWVNGNTYPKLENLKLLADYFGIEVSDLYIDISENNAITKRMAAYATKIHKGDLAMPTEFKHKSLSERFADGNEVVEVYEYDWEDLLMGDLFNE